MNRKLSDKKKCMAYVLNRDPDFRYSQKKIAKMMDVSQSTISNAIGGSQKFTGESGVSTRKTNFVS